MLHISPLVLWMTGLSGSGKSTIAFALEKKLQSENILCEVLDGDVLRKGINSNLGFSEADRLENVRRTAEVAKLLYDNRFVVICSLITPTERSRQIVKDILGLKSKLIYISTSLDVCINRDVKGLYQKALRGEIPEFTGVSSPFELPLHPNLQIDTENLSVDQAVDLLYAFLRKLNLQSNS